jgi:hypothetical protein
MIQTIQYLVIYPSYIKGRFYEKRESIIGSFFIQTRLKLQFKFLGGFDDLRKYLI